MSDCYTMPDGTTHRMVSDNVLVLVEPDAEEKTESGIIIPGARRKKHHAIPATVLAVGPGHYPEVRTLPHRPDEPLETSPTIGYAERIPTEVKPGDRVLLDTALAGGFASKRHAAEGDYRIVREAEILMVIGQTKVG